MNYKTYRLLQIYQTKPRTMRLTTMTTAITTAAVTPSPMEAVYNKTHNHRKSNHTYSIILRIYKITDACGDACLNNF
jgi:hypothetical protein